MASSQKTPLTLDEHRDLGIQLHAMHNALVRAQVRVGNGYAQTKGLERKAAKVVKALDELRSALDDEVAKMVTQEQWDEQQLGRVYYPGNDNES